ncbi:T9SS type A sorting domain-containing protein [Flavobacterium paronense]|uniref:T9SS type A sorting domain-containing protein n=1 Tax=Flavobacterium paronense TaxID=1392775 RepID=A0ABV5GHE8_9FLAO|nr:T9SS type A sorting domain-containing protein [Flavobacterium paronense]MDN3676460.1 T9SS type A sorting domain-containing protein [Flavobacterium paronense]
MKRLYSLIMFFALAWTYGQNSIVGYEYWFDNNYNEKVNTVVAPVPMLTINSSVATSGIESGIHTINIRSWDTNGLFSSILTSFFYKVPEQATFDRKIVTYEFWFDNDYANHISQTANNQQTFTLNTNIVPSSLLSGIHTLNILFKDNTGFSSSTLSNFFYKVPDQATFDRKIATYEYWFDNDYANKVSETANNQETFILNTNVVPTTLANGIHTFNIRFKDDSTFSSSTLSSFFYKNQNGSLVLKNIVEYEYWFNDDYSNKIVVAIAPAQTANINTFIIPENSGLGIGTHLLNIRFKDDSNLWSSIATNEFDLSTLNISDNNLLKNIVLYPNPTDGYLNIELKQVYTEIDIKVFDIKGREVYNQNNQNTDKTEIHLGFASGMYFVNITADGKSCTHKIIKQ